MNTLFKKILAASVAVLLLASCIVLFAACGKKEGGETTEPVSESTGEVVEKGFSAEINEKTLEVYKDGVPFQSINYLENKIDTVNLDFAKEHIEFIDLNFDGQDDICLSISEKKGVISHVCWLYDVKKSSFVFSEELSALKNISVDAQEKQIISETVGEEKSVLTCYEWKEGKLTEVKKLDSDSESVPEPVKDAISKNSLGTKKSDGKSTTAAPVKPSEKTTKPANTKPTQPAKPTKPAKPTQPASNVTEATQNQAESGVQYATGDIDDGWY